MSMWDEDDDLPGLGSKSRAAANPTKKLSSLFAQEEHLSASAGTGALAFQAKKAPKSQSVLPATQSPASTGTVATPSGAPVPAATAGSGVPSTSVLFATLGNLIRYDTAGTAHVVGPRASAVLRNTLATGQSVHALVCYEPSTQRQECVMTLSESMSVSVSGGQYAMFYDDSRTYYCLQLNADQLELLVTMIALTKYSHASQLTPSVSVIVQDMVSGGASDRPIANSDQIKIKYTMHLTTVNPQTRALTLGAVVGTVGTDDKPKPMRVGSKKELQGIEQGVVGMKKGGRRLLVIPPHLAYGAQAVTNISPNSVVVVDVSVLKVKHAEGIAPPPAASPTPEAAPAAVTVQPAPAQTVPAISATLTIPAPGGAAVPSSAASVASSDGNDSDDDNDNRRDADNQRSMLTKKMATMGFKMPGLPGAVDPEHSAVAQQSVAAASHVPVARSDVNECVEGRSTPASPMINSHASHGQQPAVPTITIPNSATHTRVPSNASAVSSVSAVPSNYHSQPHAQPQQVHQYPHHQPQPQQPYYQPSQPSQPSQYPHYHQQPSPQQQQQQQPQYPHQPPPHSQSHPQLNQVQPSPAYGSHYHGEGQYNHPSPSHTPSPYHFHTSTSALPSQSLMALESKLDSIQSLLAQQSRALGTNNAAVLFDAPLTGAQLLRAFQSILQEHDDSKSKLESSDKRIAELIAKLESQQERFEKWNEETSRMNDRRYENFNEELKAKNNLIHELSLTNKKLETELLTIRSSSNQTQGTLQSLTMELEREKLESANKRDLQQQLIEKNSEMERVRLQFDQQILTLNRTIQSLQDQSNTLESKNSVTFQSLNDQITSLQQQLAGSQRECAELKTHLDSHQSSATSSASDLQSQIQSLQTELTAARAETESVITEARSRRESNKAAMLAMIEESKAEEFERGRESAFDEIRPVMASIKDKAKCAIEALTEEKFELESRVVSVESERDELIETSRAHIQKLKQQMAAKLAEIEEDSTSEYSDEVKQSVLKSLYGGMSKSLQQYGEHRWRAIEIAQLVKAEIQFQLTGEKPDIEISSEDDIGDSDRALATKAELIVSETSTVDMYGESQHVSASEQQQQQLQVESLNIGAIEELHPEPVHVGDSAVPANHDQPSVKVGESDDANNNGNDYEEDESADKASVLSTASPSPVGLNAIDPVPETPLAATQSSAHTHTEAEYVMVPKDGDDSAEPSMEANSVNGDIRNDSSTSAPVDDVISADSGPMVDADEMESDDTEQVEQQFTHDIGGSSDSASADPSAPMSVDSEDTFEHPKVNYVIPSSLHHAVLLHTDSGATAEKCDEESTDTLAPLPAIRAPVLEIDTGAASNYIAPPTPTLLTPPASTARSAISDTSNDTDSTSSSPRGTLISPTVSREPEMLSDPFEDGVSQVYSEPVMSATNSGTANVAKRNSLFEDDDDHENSLFAVASKPVARPKPVASPSTSLFGDSDDEEDGHGLFK